MPPLSLLLLLACADQDEARAPRTAQVPPDEAWVWCKHGGQAPPTLLMAARPVDQPGAAPITARVAGSWIWLSVPPGDGDMRLSGITSPMNGRMKWVGAELGKIVHCTDLSLAESLPTVIVQVIDDQGRPVEGAALRCGSGAGKTDADGRGSCPLDDLQGQVTAHSQPEPAWAWAAREASGTVSAQDGEMVELLLELPPPQLTLPERPLTEAERGELATLADQLQARCGSDPACLQDLERVKQGIAQAPAPVEQR